jgi:hypothetical protein
MPLRRFNSVNLGSRNHIKSFWVKYINIDKKGLNTSIFKLKTSSSQLKKAYKCRVCSILNEILPLITIKDIVVKT